MMKFVLITIFIFNSYLFSSNFSKEATIKPELIQKNAKEWCPVCGMKISKYYKTSHTAKLKTTGAKRQYCSIRCLAVDMDEYGIKSNSVKVVDVKSQKLIDSKKAYYVVKSRVKGTMSKVSKLAFKNIEDAKNHIKKYGGKIVSFNMALNMAKESLKSDIGMINKKRAKKIYPMGKKIFKKKCKSSIDPTEFIQISQLKESIVKNGLCKPLKEKQLQMVSVYLWDVKRRGDLKSLKGQVVVKTEEKCPVCGMFPYKYPRWAAQIFYKHNNHKHHYSFDGVKDLMKFYFDPLLWGKYENSKKKNITKILVTDYYWQKGIDGTKAFYVIRSDIYGPMGHELIPFENIEDAKTFKKDHYGKKIIKFKDITAKEVYKLDAD